MPVTFAIEVRSIVTGSQGDLVDVVKRVEFDVIAADQGETHRVPCTKVFDSADPSNFTPLDQLTESQVVAWLEEDDALVANAKEVAMASLARRLEESSLQRPPLPWVPAEPPPAEDVVS